MWSSIWSRASAHARDLYATLLDNSFSQLPCDLAGLHLCRTASKTYRPRPRDSQPCREVHHYDHPSVVLPRHQFSYPKVPASPKQGRYNGMDRVHSFDHPHFNALAFHPGVWVGSVWCCSRI
uniref:Uncharacterized protein n=1 Tax=Opuntia streptacantha TaxID=393608 RepID=A0A7C8YL72_OPUST